LTAPSLNELLDLALAAAREAGELTLRYFQNDPAVEVKPDRSPVTLADRETEAFLRRRIEQRFPDHGICGEEGGETRPKSPYRWWLDPIDGTVAFIHGVPLYSVVVGLEHAGEAIVGVVHCPAVRETIWARRDGGAWWNDRRARVSEVERLEEATLLHADRRLFEQTGRGAAWDRLRAACAVERAWGDCYGHLLVATGRAEIMLDPVLNPWESCALLVLLEEAGGSFRDWNGNRTFRGDSGVSTNAALCSAVWRLLREPGQAL